MASRSNICPICGMENCAEGTNSERCLDGLCEANQIGVARIAKTSPGVAGLTAAKSMCQCNDLLSVQVVGAWLRDRVYGFVPEAYETYSKLTDEELERRGDRVAWMRRGGRRVESYYGL